MTILFNGTPAAEIWKTALDGQVLEDVSRRPVQVVYSLTPSVLVMCQRLVNNGTMLTVVKLAGRN